MVVVSLASAPNKSDRAEQLRSPTKEQSGTNKFKCSADKSSPRRVWSPGLKVGSTSSLQTPPKHGAAQSLRFSEPSQRRQAIIKVDILVLSLVGDLMISFKSTGTARGGPARVFGGTETGTMMCHLSNKKDTQRYSANWSDSNGTKGANCRLSAASR